MNYYYYLKIHQPPKLTYSNRISIISDKSPHTIPDSQHIDGITLTRTVHIQASGRRPTRVALFGFAILVLALLYYLLKYFSYYFRDFSTAELQLPFFGMYSALNFICSLATGLLFAAFLYLLFLALTRDMNDVNQSLSQKAICTLRYQLAKCVFVSDPALHENWTFSSEL